MFSKRRVLVSFLCGLLAFGYVFVAFAPSVSAFTKEDVFSLYNNTPYFDPTDKPVDTCSVGTADTIGVTSTTGSSTASNIDYAGRRILSSAQLKAIADNQNVYEQAADQVKIPWQMIAVIHLRESGLKLANPDNGQGLYQFADKHGGPYPTGSVDQQEFLRQTILAAQYIKGKASANYDGNKDLTPQSDPDTIKDTFFSYNGRAQAYITQATSLGFKANSQGFEGSPYVMNKADAKRDPDVNPDSWGQIKTDGGPLVYPANSDYGAFVEYAALSGLAIGSSCGSSSSTVTCSGPSAQATVSVVRQNVVCLAQKELQLWNSGQLKAGVSGGYGKYSQGVRELWCADFASWIYDQANYPLQPDPHWRVPAVDGILAIGLHDNKFHWHNAGSYTPRPGDLVIHKIGESHVNIVVGVTGKKMTTIGGDEHPDSRGYPDGSIVNTYTTTGFSGVDGISGYVSPD